MRSCTNLATTSIVTVRPVRRDRLHSRAGLATAIAITVHGYEEIGCAHAPVWLLRFHSMVVRRDRLRSRIGLATAIVFTVRWYEENGYASGNRYCRYPRCVIHGCWTRWCTTNGWLLPAPFSTVVQRPRGTHALAVPSLPLSVHPRKTFRVLRTIWQELLPSAHRLNEGRRPRPNLAGEKTPVSQSSTVSLRPYIGDMDPALP